MRHALIALCFCVPALAQDVWVVDESGGGDFVEIQDAVDVATQRDTILVKDGTYFDFVISNKALNVVAESGADVRIWTHANPLQVRDLPHGRDVLLSGLRSRFALGSDAGAAQGGGVLLQDCEEHYFGGPLSAPAIEVRSALAFAAIVGGGFVGRSYPGVNPELDGGHGLVKPGTSFTRMLAYHTRFSGGEGGDGQSLACFGGGDGGDGAQVAGGVLILDDVVLQRGLGGDGCNPGVDGEDLRVIPPGTTVSLTTPPSELILPALLREGEAFEVRVEAPPGTQVALIASDEMQARDLGPSIGVLVPESPITVVPLGVVPANGVLVVPMTAPQLAAGDESRRWFYQGMVVQSGARYLTNPRALIVIDDAL